MALKNKKSLGQNWLKDRATLLGIAELASVAEASESPTVLEIGPGLGTLTSALFKFFDQVIAVEFDEELARKLPASFPGKNLEVIHANILDFDLGVLPNDYVAVGNIPYYITSPIIMKLLTAKHKPARIVLMIQKEVAERIAAPVGDHTILSLAAQSYAAVELGPVVKRELFTPPPKIDSQVIILTPREQPLLTEDELAFAKQAFRNPRKKLTTTLPFATGQSRESIAETLQTLQINPDSRPQDLTHQNWHDLCKTIQNRSRY